MNITITPEVSENYLSSRITDAHRAAAKRLNRSGSRFPAMKRTRQGFQDFGAQEWNMDVWSTKDPDVLEALVSNPQHWDDVRTVSMNRNLTEEQVLELLLVALAADSDVENNELLHQVMMNSNCPEAVLDWALKFGADGGEFRHAVFNNADKHREGFVRFAVREAYWKDASR